MNALTKNGYAPEQVELAPGFHKERGVFVTQSGQTFTIAKTNPLLIERLVDTQQGKPDVPVIEVSAPGGRKRLESNPRDPDYLEAVAVWEREKQIKLLVYLFSKGIRENPTPEEVENLRDVLPDESEAMYKYLWVGEKVEGDLDTGEAILLMQAIMGLVRPTQEGLEEAAASFQSDGQRLPD